MDNEKKLYKVTNRSGTIVSYSIPELNNLKRVFAAGETKSISYEELEKLTYILGGSTLIANYLLIKEDNVLENLSIHTEPEYKMNREQIVELMTNGSLDAFLDCLDFAPEGVLQIIKDEAVNLPLNDVRKREAILEKLNFDVDKAILNKKASQDDNVVETKAERRVTPASTQERRVETPTYNVVNTK